MRILVGKGDNLSLDTRTIARSDALNLSIEQRRVRQALAQDFVCTRIGIDGKTRTLAQLPMDIRHKRKFMEILIAVLRRGQFEMYAAAVYAYRSSRLHASADKSDIAQLLGYAATGRLAGTTARDHCTTYMHQTVEKCAIGKHHGTSRERGAIERMYTGSPTVTQNKTVHGILPHIQIGRVL